MGEILVGTASWTDKTLLESGWYPPRARTAEDRLRFYASKFSLMEVEATYYAPPAERTACQWCDRTPEHFTFNVKAFSLLAGHPTRVASLYSDRRARVPARASVCLDACGVQQLLCRPFAAQRGADGGAVGLSLVSAPLLPFPLQVDNVHYVK